MRWWIRGTLTPSRSAACATLTAPMPTLLEEFQGLWKNALDHQSEPKASPTARSRGSCSRAPITSPQAGFTFQKERNALQVKSHREGTHGTERVRDPLRSPARRRRNRPLTCGHAVLGSCGRRSGVAGLCESRRAHSEPSCQRAPTVTTTAANRPRTAPRRLARRQVELYCDI